MNEVSLYTYRIFGLEISSELEFPGIQSVSAEQIDVIIKFGTTPNHLQGIVSAGVLFESSKEEFLLKLPNVGIYYVKDGSEITIDPKSTATQDEIRLFLMGSVFGALLFQRGFTPLHGSAVDINGKALIIMGNSAAGKSTLAASLVQSGYKLISDDLSAISMNSGKCVILPGFPFVKLWEDVRSLLFPGDSFNRVRPQLNKYYIPTKTNISTKKESYIHTIINLKVRNSNTYSVDHIIGANKFAALRDNVFRDQFLNGMGMMDHHFNTLSALANQVKIFHVERPSFPLEIGSLKKYVISEILER